MGARCSVDLGRRVSLRCRSCRGEYRIGGVFFLGCWELKLKCRTFHLLVIANVPGRQELNSRHRYADHYHERRTNATAGRYEYSVRGEADSGIA